MYWVRSGVGKGLCVFEGCAEVWGFTWEKRRSTLAINHLISTNWSLPLPHLILLILGTKSEFVSKVRNLIKKWVFFQWRRVFKELSQALWWEEWWLEGDSRGCWSDVVRVNWLHCTKMLDSPRGDRSCAQRGNMCFPKERQAWVSSGGLPLASPAYSLINSNTTFEYKQLGCTLTIKVNRISTGLEKRAGEIGLVK